MAQAVLVSPGPLSEGAEKDEAGNDNCTIRIEAAARQAASFVLRCFCDVAYRLMLGFQGKIVQWKMMQRSVFAVKSLPPPLTSVTRPS